MLYFPFQQDLFDYFGWNGVLSLEYVLLTADVLIFCLFRLFLKLIWIPFKREKQKIKW